MLFNSLVVFLGAISLGTLTGAQQQSNGTEDVEMAEEDTVMCIGDKHPFDPYKHKKIYRMGIHASRGFDFATESFNTTFTEYLTRTAGQMFDPPIEFELVPYLMDELYEAIYAEDVDFFYVNPGIYTCIATEIGASALVTIVSEVDNQGEKYELDHYAGVMMARKDNDEVNSILDTRDKIIGAGSTSVLMGGQMEFYEMQEAGLSYVNDPKQVVLTHNQFDVVNGVLDGTFDIGFVRTGTIEQTRDEDGKYVDPDLFKILEPKIYVMEDGNMFPFLHSTDTVPEWPVSAVESVPKDVALEVQQALLALRHHARVGKKLQECRATSSLENCKSLADETLGDCSETALNITLCHIMADQSLAFCKSKLHSDDCEAMPFPYSFDKDARCDTTKDIAEISLAASKAGKFAGFRPSLGYFEVRSVQQAAGFMKQNQDGDWFCPRPSSLYDGIDCPDGYYKRDLDEFTHGCERQGLGCKEGHDCFCKPCVEAFEVDVYPFQEGDIDHHIEDFFGEETVGCQKMSICGTVQQGHTITMRAYDNMEREGANVTVVAHADDSKTQLKVTRIPGTFAYEFDITDKVDRVQVIEISFNGVQLKQSPIRVVVEPLDCDETYGVGSNRVPSEEGECVCANNSFAVAGGCLESQLFFLLIFSAVFVGVAALVFVYLGYKKQQNDSVWHINVDELHFNEPPEVVGQGAFGVVVLGQYRGTKVAVKRVIPPENKSAHNRTGSVDSTESIEDPLHSGSQKPNTTVNSSSEKKSSSKKEKGTSSEAQREDKIESHSSKKGVQFKSINMVGDIEAPPSKIRGTMSGNQSWEDLMRPQKYNSVLKILETATLSSHGSNEISGSLSVTTSRFSRVLPDFLRFDDHARRRREFVNEMRLLSRLRHPCITTVMGAVISSNTDPMLVMEFMEYGSLYDLLRNETMYAGGEILLQITRDIVQGIQFLHASKPPIFHGDLKAKNILVDTRFRAKVADFGFAHFQKKAEKLNILQGTPFFMAPEYLTRRHEFNEACDIYSLSMIIYEIYARKDPFEGEDPRKILPKVCHPRVNKRPPIPDSCPPKMAEVMKKCWSANPFFRPSAKELDYIFVEMNSNEAEPLARGDSSSPFKDGMRRKPTSLYDVFPKHIADALNAGRRVEAESHEVVTVVFSDIVGFTSISQTFPPLKIANLLDRLYQAFDALAVKHSVFKIETIGDAYMGVTNLDGTQFETHARLAAEFAIDIVEAASHVLIDEDCEERGTVQIRVGFHSGPVVSNVIGSLNPRYGLFGDTVNTASRMETNSAAGQILCTYASAKFLETQAPHIAATMRGKIQVKGKGKMITYWIGKQGDDPQPQRGQTVLELQESFSESHPVMEDGSEAHDGDGNISIEKRKGEEGIVVVPHNEVASGGTNDTEIISYEGIPPVAHITMTHEPETQILVVA